jgi:hypothetical protein
MNISYNQKVAIIFGIATVSLLLMPFVGKPHRVPQRPATGQPPVVQDCKNLQPAGTTSVAPSLAALRPLETPASTSSN